MKNIKPAKFLIPDQVTTVTSSDTFTSSLLKEFIHEAVQDTIQKYPEEIHILIKLSLPILAEGFCCRKDQFLVSLQILMTVLNQY